MNSKEQFTQRLTRAVERAGLNWNSLADRLSETGERVNAPIAYGWRDGAVPGGEYLMRLVVVLDVDGHWLLTGEGGPERRPPGLADNALGVIESVVDASKDAERFARFWGYWLTFNQLLDFGDTQDEGESGPRP